VFLRLDMLVRCSGPVMLVRLSGTNGTRLVGRGWWDEPQKDCGAPRAPLHGRRQLMCNNVTEAD
jgi:hypothetical protein